MVNERLTIFSRAVNEVHTFMKTPRSRKGSYGSSKHDYSKEVEAAITISKITYPLDFDDIIKQLEQIGIRDSKAFLYFNFKIVSSQYLSGVVKKAQEASAYFLGLLNGNDTDGEMNSKLIDMRRDDKLFYRLVGAIVSDKLGSEDQVSTTVRKFDEIQLNSGHSLIQRVFREFVVNLAQITEKKFNTGRIFTDNLEKEISELNEKLSSEQEDIRKEVLISLYKSINNENTDFILDRLVDYTNAESNLVIDTVAMKVMFSNLLKGFQKIGIEHFGKPGKEVTSTSIDPMSCFCDDEIKPENKYVVKKTGWKVKDTIVREATIESIRGDI